MINGEERRRFALTSPRPHTEGSHQDCFTAFRGQQNLGFCFFASRENDSPSPSCGRFEFPGTALTKCSGSRRVRRTLKKNGKK